MDGRFSIKPKLDSISVLLFLLVWNSNSARRKIPIEADVNRAFGERLIFFFRPGYSQWGCDRVNIFNVVWKERACASGRLFGNGEGQVVVELFLRSIRENASRKPYARVCLATSALSADSGGPLLLSNIVFGDGVHEDSEEDEVVHPFAKRTNTCEV